MKYTLYVWYKDKKEPEYFHLNHKNLKHYMPWSIHSSHMRLSRSWTNPESLYYQYPESIKYYDKNGHEITKEEYDKLVQLHKFSIIIGQ